ncbi:hypothetical protein IDSA_08170 [Pseudidiomarina salinarum]|uniref:Thiol:disulfide interchange protein DsbD n=2 Tax=Pseudidiomarina salinarum TaxID=435908 RepID=A0A094ITQ2_9GAMM|nr:hypothetical protein IDSA_08170 [Pseudidiomarina salinarum]
MRLAVLFSLFFALLLTTTAPAFGQAGNFPADDDPFAQQKFLPVDEAFQFDFRQQGDKLILSWDIADGYYLYQHRFSPDPAAELAELPVYPPGEEHVDEFFGESIVYRDHVSITYVLNQAAADQSFTVSYQGCADAGLCYPPTDKTIYLDAVAGDGSTGINVAQVAANSQQSTSNSLLDFLHQQPLWLSLAMFLVLGIGLAFTPCVLPMYPIISAIIMGQQHGARQREPISTRRAFTLSLAYVQGMAITYSLLGVVVALAGLRYQAMLQHPAILITLATLFILLALSMLSAYTLQLPQRVQQYLNDIVQARRGGAHPSVFLMGALSGLIVSPCTTAPLSGVLLFIAQSGDLLIGGAVLYALSVGMGLPLLLFGVTGGKLLPKAGAWMNTVKRLFGVVLLAVALVLVERLLPYVIADWLWIGFIFVSACYLIFSGWRELSTRAAGVFSAIWLTIATILMIQWWPHAPEDRLPFTQVQSLAEIKQQLSAAEQENRLVMLDLYADWCVACKEFERYTFTDERVKKALGNALLLQADVTANTPANNAILREYQVLGLPTILFFYQGDELSSARVTGFMPAETFARHVEQLQ